MTIDEVRLERLRPDEIAAALGRAPIAWIPLGALEFHAPHLPNGTDGFTGHGLLVAAARRLGGVVLPWSYVTLGTLALPWSFRFDPGLVAETLRQTLRQLPKYGVRLAVVHTGHAPLDLIHLIKRVCAEVEGTEPTLQAMGLCYLELNAALGTGLGSAWPVAVDHASTMETSWVAALEPDLVAMDRLPDDPGAAILGVYGPNPRLTVDPAGAAGQIDAAAALLADRAAGRLRGESHDPLGDLKTFVERYWPERLVLTGRAWEPGQADGATIGLTNPGPVSRYISGLELHVDGDLVPAAGLALVNTTVGEPGVALPVTELGPERGFYIRRQQTAELHVPVQLAPGPHEISLRLGLGGVSEGIYAESVAFS